MCGERGEHWLDALGFLLADIEFQWSIDIGDPFPAAEFNYVAPATDAEGNQYVLKIAPPFETNEIVGEAMYLRSRNGTGAVRLIKEWPGSDIILLERAIPGKNLAEEFAGNEFGSIRPAIDVMRTILGPPPDGISQTVDDWFKGMHRAADTEFPTAYVEKAFDIYHRLSHQPDRTYYLHGDFHPANIVSATRSPYLVIDPKGVVGHIGYDIAVFLNNFHWWQETLPDVRTRLDRAVREFSEAFDIDALELREWAFAQMVLGAWWSFDDMPQFYTNELAKADIWNV
jgi:streptomycin 6-kinase